MDRRFALQALGLSIPAAQLLGCQTSVMTARVHPAPGMPSPAFVDTNGITLGVYEAGQGTPIVFCHGFPELAYSWRHQFQAAIDAGYRAIAPDLRGYGQSSRPSTIADYSAVQICDDLVGLLDAFGIERAIFCGHDWGAYIADSMPLLYPERCLGVVTIGAPNNQRPADIAYSGRRGVPELVDKPGFNAWLQQPHLPEQLLANNTREFFRLMWNDRYFMADRLKNLPPDTPARRMSIPDMLASGFDGGSLLLSRDALDYYVATFQATGFEGALNWYRAIPTTLAELETRNRYWGTDMPYLYVWPEQDPINRVGLDNGMEDYLGNLTKQTLDGSGHFAMEHKPAALNTMLLAWLNRHFPG